ncbi:MAG: LuxR C-terminal-related transcriptional regulator [Egibacteraceae bacterium]
MFTIGAVVTDALGGNAEGQEWSPTLVVGQNGPPPQDVRRIRLLVAEGRELHRAALGAAFDAEDDLEVVAQVADESAALERTQRLEPDVVCVGPGRPVRVGLAICERIKAQRPAQRVLVIDDLPDSGVLAAAFRAGANGYATKDRPIAALVEAVRRVHAGEVVVPTVMLGGLLLDLALMRRQANAADEVYLRLTAREKQVLGLLGEGRGNTVIARTLMISPQTVRTHIRNVVRKLEVRSRLEAAAMAVQHGWLHNATGRH